MAQISFKGKLINTLDKDLSPGQTVPDFTLTDSNLQDFHLSSVTSPYVLLNVVPSIDTPVCAASAREFDRQARIEGSSCSYITVSRDLPFAQSRFALRENLENMILLSDMRFDSFAADYGVLIADGPLKGLCARAVFLLGPSGPGEEGRPLIYREMVKELAWEPDYGSVLEKLHGITHRPA